MTGKKGQQEDETPANKIPGAPSENGGTRDLLATLLVFGQQGHQEASSRGSGAPVCPVELWHQPGPQSAVGGPELAARVWAFLRAAKEEVGHLVCYNRLNFRVLVHMIFLYPSRAEIRSIIGYNDCRFSD